MREQAKIQFEKLLEIAQDIEEFGTDKGNLEKRSIVISGLVNTENEFLYQKFDEVLNDTTQLDILHTLITGIYLHKKRYASLAIYVNSILKNIQPLDENFENKQALLLCTEGLIKSCQHEDTILAQKFLPELKKLFISACLEDSGSTLADKLLQTFLAKLSFKNQQLSDFLLEILNDKNADFNAKLISIDILSRIDKPACTDLILDILLNPKNYANDSVSLLYLLDVTTKAAKALKDEFPFEVMAKILSILNNLEYSNIRNDELADIIIKRIQERMKSLNDSFNSIN